jgi:UDP-glucose 4-epimerase
MDLGAAHFQAVDYLQRADESVALNLGIGNGHLVKR